MRIQQAEDSGEDRPTEFKISSVKTSTWAGNGVEVNVFIF